jgi:hypothetical protein
MLPVFTWIGFLILGFPIIAGLCEAIDYLVTGNH